MIGVVTFTLFLWHLCPVSNIYAKFIDSQEIQRNALKCWKLNTFADKKINELFEPRLILSQLKKVTDLCFIRCLYHVNGIVDDSGNISIGFVIPYLHALTKHSADTESEVQDTLVRLAEDIILVCHRSSASAEKLCLASVTAVECIEAVLYLFDYGYLNLDKEDLLTFNFTPAVYRSAIIQFQTYFSLTATGTLDSDTLELMNSPRCGDVDVETPQSRNKRYDLYKLKWNSQHLTYRISRYSVKIHKNLTDEEMSRAFSAWTNVSNLSVEKSEFPKKADIIIRFEKRVHGDRVPFDGPGRVLAHTFYPTPTPIEQNRLHSLIHFDDAEKWTVNSEVGVNLYQIAVHEIGHSLGLKHSNVKNSVMWPKHDGYVANYTLHSDDIDAIQALYGSAKK